MLNLELAIEKIYGFSAEQREEIIKFVEFIDYKYSQNIKDKDNTPDEVIINSIKEGLKEAINGETIPLSQMWEGIDFE